MPFFFSFLSICCRCSGILKETGRFSRVLSAVCPLSGQRKELKMKENEVFYVGRVGSVLDGYGFISIRTIRRMDGMEHNLKHDVFVHLDDYVNGFELKEGLLLQFACGQDLRRGDDFRRAINVTTAPETALLPLVGSVIPGLVHEIPYHVGMKEIPIEQVTLAMAIHPLEGLPCDEATVQVPDDDEGLRRVLTEYLMVQFPQLGGVGIDYTVIGYDEQAQNARIAEEKQALMDLDMATQANELQEAYDRFKAVRRLLVITIERGFFRPGTQLSPAIFQVILSLIEKAENSGEKLEAVTGVEETIGFMIEKGLLRPNTIIPNRHLVELFVACPVWFWVLSGQDATDAKVRATVRDPEVHPVTEAVCRMFQNQRWYDVFQMFNRRTRGLDRYQGEIITRHIRELLRPAAQVFDAVAIITPYHDVAGVDWGDLAWLRSIDPYVIGFKWGLPVFFILGRYSDSGIFPLIQELTADTMLFLRSNLLKLENFNLVQSPYWFTGSKRDGLFKSKMGTYLVERTQEMTQAFEAGHLFDWLRGEWDFPTTAVDLSSTP